MNRQAQPLRAIDLPPQSPRWNPRRLRVLSGSVCQAGDLILLAGAALCIAVLPCVTHHGLNRLGDFLQLRVSLRNVFVSAMCISTWRMILMSVGVYSPTRTRSISNYLFRCVIALNSCTAVVGLIEVILQPGRDAWRTVELFWFVALLMTATLRLVLVRTHAGE